MNAKKVVLYTDNSSDYAKGVAKAFRESFKGEIVADETFVSGDTDFQAALTKIKDKEFDAIVLPGYYTEAGKIVNQARGMGIDKPIIGGDGFNGEEFVQQATAEEHQTFTSSLVSHQQLMFQIKQKPSLKLTVQNTTKILQHLQLLLMTQFTL